MAKKANRDPFFDNAKILLMLLVVLGHVLQYGQGILCTATNKWIYSFHMPLFVFLSGYFTKVENRDKFIKGLLKLVETYAVFTIVHVCISFLLGKGVSFLNMLLIPRWTLWYLLSLIWWRIVLYIIPLSIRNNHIMLVVISVILCLIMGWIPIGMAFSFHRTFSFFPFFMLGYVAAQTGTINRIKLSPFFAIAIMLIIWCVYYMNILPLNLSLLMQKNGYNHYDNPLLAFLFRFGWLFFASLMSVCFLSVVSRKEYKWTHFGQLTLFIYMYHSVLLSWRLILRDEFHNTISFPYCVFYSIILLCIIYLMSKMKFFHWLLNPVTPIVYNRKKE